MSCASRLRSPCSSPSCSCDRQGSSAGPRRGSDEDEAEADRRSALGVVVLIVLPFAVSGFRTEQLASVGATFIAILGLDILIGFNGQVSLGHGAFMAVGGYTTAILVANHGIRDLWTIAAAAGVAGAVGLLVGVPALRLRGLYLALVTFGVAVVLPTVLLKFDHFTGGSTGISFFGNPHADRPR